MFIHKEDFALLRNNQRMSYLDCAATTPMPDQVMEAWMRYQENVCVSIGHGNNKLTGIAEKIYNESVEIISHFLNANNYDFIFTKNATESSNLLSYIFKDRLNPGDIVLTSEYDHHSNLLPWMRVAQQAGAQVMMIPIEEDGGLDYEYIKLIEPRKIKIAALSLVSNVNGQILEVKKIRKYLDKQSVLILDIAQAVGHMELDLDDLDATAYILSAHKMYAPKNIGACVIKRNSNYGDTPFLIGGGMTYNVIGAKKSWKDTPMRFHAGTFDVGLIKAWAVACQYIQNIGWKQIKDHEQTIMKCMIALLQNYPATHILPSTNNISAICSFYVENIHPHDVGRIFSDNEIIIRTGHMCAQYALNSFMRTSISRISFGICNNNDDIIAVEKVLSRFFKENKL